MMTHRVLLSGYHHAGLEEAAMRKDMNESKWWKVNAYYWRFWVERAHEFMTDYHPTQYSVMHYEDYWTAPSAVVDRFEHSTHCKLRRSVDLKLDPSRVYPWLPEDPQAQEVWEIVKDCAEKFGYDFTCHATVRV
jgi:hypothetical protein